MPFALLTALLLLLPSGAAAQASERVAPSSAPRWLSDSIGQALTEEGLVGASWSTLDTDGTVRLGVAGMADAPRRERMLVNHHRVQVGSVAKTLLALGILRLVTEGRLALDTPVATLLPELAVDNPWEARSPLRVRHLLDHTSGLDDAKLWQVLSLRPASDTPLSTAFTRQGAPLRLQTEPGTRSSYSSQGYTLLGMIIERVTSSRYEQYLDAHLIEPLGMTRSTFTYVSQASTRPDTTLAMGHFENGKPQAIVPQYLRPATQFTTTASDMMLLAAFMVGDGTLRGAPFIDAALLASMLTVEGTEAASAGLRVGFALGLAVRDRHGVLAHCQAGNTVGYRAMFCIMPTSKQAFFISMNADVEGADFNRFDALLLASLRAPVQAEQAASTPDADRGDWSGIYTPDPTRFLISAYLDQVFGFVRVTSTDAGIRMSPFLGTATELTAVGPRLYRAPGRRIASHVLLTTSDGHGVLSDGAHSWQRISIVRMLPQWLSALIGVIGACGLLYAGLLRVTRRAISTKDPGFAPITALFALVLPVPFFFVQSFLAIGDLTIASALTALVTGALPLALVFGIVSNLRIGVARTRASLLETCAMAALLQWTVMLAFWGVVPLRLWA